MQYEAIRDERRMAANTATRIGDAFLSLLSFGQSFLDVFLRKDVDDTAKGRITFNNGAVNKGIVVFSEDGTFADGLTGHGARIRPDGSAELDSLTLRRFLEVPELRFNRVSVHVGNQWRAPGGGIIRSVSPAADATGTALLHLEAGEIGTVAVGDLCMGIYHSETAADNASESADDNHGNFRFAGFYTAYWEITAVADYTDDETGQTFHNGKVSYRLRPVSANYPRQMHPTAAMHFVCYGNRTDAARQSSRYSTLTYERFLTGVSDWEFTSKQIRMQVGDLSAFSPVPGMDFSGYSVYANSIYLDGHLKQLAELGDPNPYTYSVDNLADTLALDAKGKPKQPVVSTLADGSKSWLLHTSIQVRRGQTILTCLEDTTASPSTGQYRLLCLPVGCTAHFDHSTLYIDSVDYSSRPTAYVEVTIDCEGRAALTYVFTIKVIADGDRGEQGRDGTAYGTRRRYALSARATTASPHTPPDDVATWQDVPLATTDARPYLWIELTDWQQQAGGLQTFSPVSSYVRLTGDRGQRGEDGLDGKDGKSWTLRGTALGHVTNMASLPSPAPDGIFLVDTGAEGTPSPSDRWAAHGPPSPPTRATPTSSPATCGWPPRRPGPTSDAYRERRESEDRREPTDAPRASTSASTTASSSTTAPPSPPTASATSTSTPCPPMRPRAAGTSIAASSPTSIRPPSTPSRPPIRTTGAPWVSMPTRPSSPSSSPAMRASTSSRAMPLPFARSTPRRPTPAWVAISPSGRALHSPTPTARASTAPPTPSPSMRRATSSPPRPTSRAPSTPPRAPSEASPSRTAD